MRCDWSKVGEHIWVAFDRLLKIGQNLNCQPLRNDVVVVVFNLITAEFGDALENG